nr:RDD family protein [Salsipaludibacter albus]
MPPVRQDAAVVPAPRAPLVAPAPADRNVVVPAGTHLTSVGKKFVSYLLDGLLSFVTLGIGWLIWGAIVAGGGQTPARQLLGMRVISQQTLRPLGWAQMVFMRGIVGSIIQGFAFLFTFFILVFMPLWDRRNQTVCDKVSSSIVVDDPHGVLR